MENTEHDYYVRHFWWLTIILFVATALFAWGYVVYKWAGFLVFAFLLGVGAIFNIFMLILESKDKLD